MDYYCEVCLKHIKAMNKCKYFKSKSHIEFDKCTHIKISHQGIYINNVDEAFYLYIREHNKIFEYYLRKCDVKFVFSDYHYFPNVTSKLCDSKTMIPRKIFLEKVIDDFKDKGYAFSHIAEMHIMKRANKMDMSYDFYIKHIMHAVEWKLNAMIDKNKNLINKFDRNWRHPLNKKFESYPVWNL